jgi:DNA-binding MarR family transcriptional regulator
MTRTINCLDEAGFICRSPHPDDGRQTIVSISAKGEEILATERARRDQWLAKRFAQLTTAERKLLREATVLLDTLTAS